MPIQQRRIWGRKRSDVLAKGTRPWREAHQEGGGQGREAGCRDEKPSRPSLQLEETRSPRTPTPRPSCTPGAPAEVWCSGSWWEKGRGAPAWRKAQQHRAAGEMASNTRSGAVHLLVRAGDSSAAPQLVCLTLKMLFFALFSFCFFSRQAGHSQTRF